MLYEPLIDESEESPEAKPTISGDAPGASSDLDASQHFTDEARAERMQLAMLDVMSGAIARGRNLKYWENLRLRPVHMQMLLMKAAGFTQRKIATDLNYDEARVSVIVNHPDAQYLLSHLVSFQAEKLLDVNARIQAHAGEALDTALMLMRNGKEETRERVAFRILGAAGYGATKKIEVNNKFEMPVQQANQLTHALREATEVEDMTDAEFEILENGPAAESGSSELDESALVEPVQSEPPVLNQQVSVPLQPMRRTA